MKGTTAVIRICLGLLLLLGLLAGLRNHNALLNSDQYSYLIYGQALSRGSFQVDYPLLDLLRERLPPGSYRYLSYGRRHYVDGKVFSGLEPGFPLLLGLGIRLAGLPGAFGVNVFLLAVFIVAYFSAVRGQGTDSEWAALAAVFIFLRWENNLGVRYSLILMRDIPAVAFFWLGLCCLFKAIRPGNKTMVCLLAASAATAFACMIRLTTLVLVPPLAIYALAGLRRKGLSWKAIMLAFIGAVVVFTLIFLPQIVEDWSLLGRPADFIARALNPFEDFFEEKDALVQHTFSLANFRRNFPRNLADIYHVISPLGLFLLIAGLYFYRRRLSTWLVMLPVPIVNLLVFSAFTHRARRYRFPIFAFAAYFISAGTVGLIGLLRRLDLKSSTVARRMVFLTGILSGAVFAARILRGTGWDYLGVFLFVFSLTALLPAAWNERLEIRFQPEAVFAVGAGVILLPFMIRIAALKSSFGWTDAQKLKFQFERFVPEAAIVLGERYLIQNIDIYTHAHGISPGNLALAFGGSLEEAVNILLESGRPVFALDNRGFRSMRRNLDRLRSSFNLAGAGGWESADLKIDNPYYSGRPILSLFRILPRAGRSAGPSPLPPAAADFQLPAEDENNRDQ